VLFDELPGIGHIYVEQGIDAVLPPIEVKVIVSDTACGG
jgi:hypothetical protein